MAKTILTKDGDYLAFPHTERGKVSAKAFQFWQADTDYTDLAIFDTGTQGAVGGCFALFKNDATDYLVTVQVSMDGQTWTNVTAYTTAGAAHAGAEVTLTNNAWNYFFLSINRHPELAYMRYWKIKGKCSAADRVDVNFSASIK